MRENRFYENGIMRTAFLLSDILFISLLYLLVSLPVITLGASTAALHHTVRKLLARQEGTPWREFLESFWRNLPGATALGAFGTLFLGFLVFDCILIFPLIYSLGGFYWVLGGLLAIGGILGAMWLQLWLPCFVRYPDRVKPVMINCFWITAENPGRCLVLLLLRLLGVAIGLFFFHLIWPVALLLPAAWAMLLSPLQDRLFQKYAKEPPV